MISSVQELLGDDAIVDIVEAIIVRMGEKGSVTPSVVVFANSLLPAPYQHHRALVMDLAVGTLRARFSGKGLDGWLYTRLMAEQNTHPEIARHHAEKFRGCRHVVEICTGSGHDAVALSRLAQAVTTYEADETIAAITGSNLRRAGLGKVDLNVLKWGPESILPSDADGVWADPSRRRPSKRRTHSVSEYQPGLETMPGKDFDGIVGIKIGPGDELSEATASQYDSEYIGFGRECRERVLWRNASTPRLSVAIVDQNAAWEPVPRKGQHFEHDSSKIICVIEPHAAIIAAGAVEELFAEVGASAIDPHIAYGLVDEIPKPSALYERFSLLRMDEGISEKRIRKRLQHLEWGSGTEFKKRGWDKDPETLRPLLPDEGGKKSGVVMIARRDSGHVTIYAERV